MYTLVSHYDLDIISPLLRETTAQHSQYFLIRIRSANSAHQDYCILQILLITQVMSILNNQCKEMPDATGSG